MSDLPSPCSPSRRPSVPWSRTSTLTLDGPTRVPSPDPAYDGRSLASKKAERVNEAPDEELDLEKQTSRIGLDDVPLEPRRSILEMTQRLEKDPNLVEFDIDDPENPKNWLKPYKWFLTIFSSILILNATFASSAPSAALADIARSLHVKTIEGICTVSLFLTGYVLGPLLWAPLSEIYGRRPIFLITFGGYTALQIGCALAKNIETLLVCRLIAGTFAASPLTNSGGVLTDIWVNNERGTPMAIFALAPFLGPVLGPICGGFIGITVGWQWVFWVLLIFAGVCYVGIIFLLPETYPPVLLLQKARRLRKETGNDALFAPQEHDTRTMGEILKVALTRPILMLFTEPLVALTSVYVAVVYGVLYMLFEAFPIGTSSLAGVFAHSPAANLSPRVYAVFEGVHGFNSGESGLTFISVGVGVFLAFLISLYFDARYVRIAKANGGRAPAEARLPQTFLVGGPAFVIGMFWFAWTSYPFIHWIAPAVAGIPIGLGVVLLFMSFLSYLADAYTAYAASALAANTVSRSVLGASFPLFAQNMFAGMQVKWAGTLLACIGLVLLPVPYFFYVRGGQLRQRSRFAAA